jgi:hypothetical protein
MRLNHVASRRVCITLSTGSSPRLSDEILDVLGAKRFRGKDFLYALNILISLNILPEVSYIKSARKDTFDNTDDIFEDYMRVVHEMADNLEIEDLTKAKEKLRLWIEQHRVINQEAGNPGSSDKPQKKYCLDVVRTAAWAFIAWDKTT